VVLQQPVTRTAVFPLLRPFNKPFTNGISVISTEAEPLRGRKIICQFHTGKAPTIQPTVGSGYRWHLIQNYIIQILELNNHPKEYVHVFPDASGPRSNAL
jgi:hypothetical protein